MPHRGCGLPRCIHGGTRHKHCQCCTPAHRRQHGASNNESTWVLTSYLVSNAIVLPISCLLVGLLGRKRFFLICIAFFTVFVPVWGSAESRSSASLPRAPGRLRADCNR